MDGPKSCRALSDLQRLRRFLSLGYEPGCNECLDVEASRINVQCIQNLMDAGKGIEIVEEILKQSAEGCTQSALIYSLAFVAKKSKDADTKQAAFAAVGEVCRIPTHLFQFVKFSEDVCDTTGWGRGQRNAVSRWYNAKDPKTLALYVTKYRQRGGWSHRDLFRLCHLKTKTEATTLLVKYVIQGLEKARSGYTDPESLASEVKEVLGYLDIVEKVKHSKDEEQVAQLTLEHKLVREQIPTWMMKSKKVWNALLPHMPAEALIRSLARLASLGMLATDSEDNCIETVLGRLNDTEGLLKARVDPLVLLSALVAYKRGGGDGNDKRNRKPKWEADPSIERALEEAFYKSIKIQTPIGLRLLIALDISTNHSTKCPGLLAGDAAVAMAMAAVRTEEVCDLVTFSACGVDTLPISREMKLEELNTKILERKGSPDCSSPMVWARENKKAYDMFIIYTEMVAYSKANHPADALKAYRAALDIPQARLLICSMTESQFTVADPDDAGMLDIVGFDSSLPRIIQQFAKGEL